MPTAEACLIDSCWGNRGGWLRPAAESIVAEVLGWRAYLDLSDVRGVCVLAPPGDPAPWRDSRGRKRYRKVSCLEAANCGVEGPEFPWCFTDARDDYQVLVWARENWAGHDWLEGGLRFVEFCSKLRVIWCSRSIKDWGHAHDAVLRYEPGDYSRALLATIIEKEPS